MVMRPGDENALRDCGWRLTQFNWWSARRRLLFPRRRKRPPTNIINSRLVTQLKENDPLNPSEQGDYNVDEKMRSATLTEAGIAKFEKWLNMENIYAEGGIRAVHHIEQALRAEVLFKRDKDYMVDDGEVIIIDEFTGRKMPGRRYSEGLHQAVKQRDVDIQRESQTLATITFQNLFRMYRKLAGMTGVAVTEAEEFGKNI